MPHKSSAHLKVRILPPQKVISITLFIIITVYFFDVLTGDEILVGGSTDSKCRRFLERRPLKLKSTGNQSIGIDITSKKYFMKKYLFFFENELIKVKNS